MIAIKDVSMKYIINTYVINFIGVLKQNIRVSINTIYAKIFFRK